ncbi:MAG: hypothetical protein ACRC6V_07035 [Bacteroidales bacterium]
MKKTIIAVTLLLSSGIASSHSMSPTIKKYVVDRITHHDVLLQNFRDNAQCYNVFVDGKPHFNPKVCLAPKGKQIIKVFVDTPPNIKTQTKVCTEISENINKSQRFQLCTSIVTYFPEQQLQSVLP